MPFQLNYSQFYIQQNVLKVALAIDREKISGEHTQIDVHNQQMPFLGRQWDQERKQSLREEGQGQRILTMTALEKILTLVPKD